MTLCQDYVPHPELFDVLEGNWGTIAPYLLDYFDTVPDVDKLEVAELIRAYYWGQRRITLNRIKHPIGDRLFASAVEKAAKSQAKSNQSPVYTYYFSYRGAHSLTDSMTGTTENYGKFL